MKLLWSLCSVWISLNSFGQIVNDDFSEFDIKRRVSIKGWQATEIFKKKALSIQYADSIFWIGVEPINQEINTSLTGKNVVGIDGKSVKLPGINFRGTLLSPLKKDVAYELFLTISFAGEKEGLKNLGVLFYPEERDQSYTHPYCRLSNIDIDSLKANTWHRVKFNVVGKGNESNITIRYIKSISEGSNNAIILIKGIHLKEAGPVANLLPHNNIINGDFEYYRNCPDKLLSGQRLFYHWQADETVQNNECIWSRDKSSSQALMYDDDQKRLYYGLSLGSPDLYSTCANLPEKMPKPYSGRCYALLSVYVEGMEKGNEAYGEYLESKLKTPLEKGNVYVLEIAYRRASFSMYATNTLGVKFTDCAFTRDSLHFKHIMPEGDVILSDSVIKNDTTWMVKKIEYAARGNEKYIVIGPFINFYGNEKAEKVGKGKYNAAYYLIDMISLYRRE